MDKMLKIIKGLEIVNKGTDIWLAAEHDVLYAGSKGLTEEDNKELLELGWSNDEPNNWFTFV